MKISTFAFLSILFWVPVSVGVSEEVGAGEPWVLLVDEELSRWESYLSYRHKIDYNGDPPVDDQGKLIPPVGLNQDSAGVFTVVEQEGELVVRVSGEIYGCLFTKEEYGNYHLAMQVKWGELKWTPRKDKLRDTGILYHSVGKPGACHWRSWMLSQEFQIMEGHMGDYWGQLSTAIDIRAYTPEYIMNPIADEKQPFLSLGEGEAIEGFCLRKENQESSDGEWTRLELLCFEDKSVHVVNGHVVMVLQNSRYKTKHKQGGAMVPLVRGKIQLQSEAAEVFFKEIKIKRLESLPAKYAILF